MSVREDAPPIRLTNVTVRHGDLLVLDNVSMDVGRGEFAAVIGPNGAGKTTLLRVILGLIPPDEGTVEIFGCPPTETGCERHRIGYVPQVMAFDVSFPVTVYETVLMGTYGKVGVGRRPGLAEREAAVAALEKVGIADLKDRPIARLSGGQRQRALIARALVAGPEILLLDEPTTGIDFETTGTLYTLLRELKAEGVAIILVSHDVGVVAAYLDTLACLNRSLVAHGRPEEVANSDALRGMYGCDVAFLHHGDAPHIVVEDH